MTAKWCNLQFDKMVLLFPQYLILIFSEYIYIYIYILERLAEGSLFHRRILWCFVSTHIPIPQRIRCLTVRTDCFYQQHSHQSQLLHSSLMLPSRITIEAGQWTGYIVWVWKYFKILVWNFKKIEVSEFRYHFQYLLDMVLLVWSLLLLYMLSLFWWFSHERYSNWPNLTSPN